MNNKNVWVLPTTEQTILHYDHSGFFDTPYFQKSETINSSVKGYNVYVTKNDEDFQENDYVITKDGRLRQVTYVLAEELEDASKVVLSTDITVLRVSSGVSLIFNDALQYFIRKANVGGKFLDIVEVEKIPLLSNNGNALFGYSYKVITPK